MVKLIKSKNVKSKYRYKMKFFWVYLYKLGVCVLYIQKTQIKNW